jgi:type IV secretion system protein VirB10
MAEVQDVNGKAAGKVKGIAIQQPPRKSGVRFATRGKMLVVGAVSIVLFVCVYGIYLSAQRQAEKRAEQITAAAQSDTPGAARPDYRGMQRHVPPVLPASSASGSGAAAPCEQINNAPWPCAPRSGAGTTTAANDPARKYHDWMANERYTIMENGITNEQAALQSDVAMPNVQMAAGGGGASARPAGQDRSQAQDNTASPPVRVTSAGSQDGAGSGSAGDLQKAYLKSIGGGGNVGVDANKAWQQDVGNSRSAGGYLPATRQDAAGNYELFAGSIIPATMVTGIDSDLPGAITATVRRTVYDSRDPATTLIPQGAKLVGEYNSMVQYGQERLMVVWNELIFPDGSTLDLKGMSGVDKIGEAGFYDQVNNHYLRVFGSAILISLFGAAAQLSQPQNSSMLTSPTMSS